MKLLQQSVLLEQNNKNHLYVLSLAKKFEVVLVDFGRNIPCQILSLPIDVLLSTGVPELVMSTTSKEKRKRFNIET
jgi:hypothetical protein